MMDVVSYHIFATKKYIIMSTSNLISLPFSQILVFDEVIMNTPRNKKEKWLKNTNLTKWDHIYERHVIFPCKKQIYFVKDLHIHNHFSIKSDNLFALVNKLCTEKKMRRVHFYSSYKSYKNEFILIINGGSSEWTDDIEDLHNELNLVHTARVINLHDNDVDPKRNNIQRSYGFSSQSYSTYKETSVPKPRLLKGTNNSVLVEKMDCLSKLIVLLKDKKLIKQNVFSDPIRNSLFSNLISPDNVLEGMSICLQECDECLVSHTDSNNCKSSEYNGVLGVSTISCNTRIIILGYGKNVAIKYCQRLWKDHHYC
jgi:hypothetical protein